MFLYVAAMSTMNIEDSDDLSLKDVSATLACKDSLFEFSMDSVSENDMKSKVEAKEKEIDRQITLATKVLNYYL